MIHDKLEKENIPSLTISHLVTFINKHTTLQHEIIIGNDVNEAFTSNAGDTARLCKQCNIIDSISTNHGTMGEPNIHARGPNRINFIFVQEISTSLLLKMVYFHSV